MKDKFEHIHHATDKRLAEMIRTHNAWRRGDPPYDEPGEAIYPFTGEEVGVILDEAARRLENYQPREIFNHEQFDCP